MTKAEITFNQIKNFCHGAAGMAYGPNPPVEEIWKRIEMTLYNMSRRILIQLEDNEEI